MFPSSRGLALAVWSVVTSEAQIVGVPSSPTVDRREEFYGNRKFVNKMTLSNLSGRLAFPAIVIAHVIVVSGLERSINCKYYLGGCNVGLPTAVNFRPIQRLAKLKLMLSHGSVLTTKLQL